ncbi:MAG: hypothetical protein JXA43_01045 [Candidatus Diapherotrites archaeon]|nr:hypothetical protein [Candidatus Diapherotrites archaeon]
MKKKWLKERWLRSLFLTVILFAIGFSDYLVEKGIRMGGWVLAASVFVVWGVLYVAKADKVLLE